MRKQSGFAAVLEAVTSGNVSGVFHLQNTVDCQFENSYFWDQCVPVDFTSLQDTIVSLIALAVVTNEVTEVTADLTLGLSFSITLYSRPSLSSLCECLCEHLWSH